VNAIHPADCAQHVIFGKCRRGTWVETTDSQSKPDLTRVNKNGKN